MMDTYSARSKAPFTTYPNITWDIASSAKLKYSRRDDFLDFNGDTLRVVIPSVSYQFVNGKHLRQAR